MAHTAQTAGRLKDRRSASFPTACLFGVLLSLVVFALLLPLASLLLLRSADPARQAGAVAYPIAILLPLLGGYLGARRRGHGGALVGLAVSTVTVFLFLATALVLSGGVLDSFVIPLYGGMLLSGTAGGFFATRKRHRRRHH